MHVCFHTPTHITGSSHTLDARQVFSKTTIVDAHCEQPYFLNPVLAACQLVNVAKEGEQPDIWDAPEDCRWVCRL
jgi:hypothetical protein